MRILDREKFFSHEFFIRRDTLNILRLISLSRVFLITVIIAMSIKYLKSVAPNFLPHLFIFYTFVLVSTIWIYYRFKQNEFSYSYLLLSVFLDYFIFTVIIFFTGGIFSKFLYFYVYFIIEAFGLLGHEGVISFTLLVIISTYFIAILNYFGINTPIGGLVSKLDLIRLRQLKVNAFVLVKAVVYLIIGGFLSYISRVLENAQIEAQKAKAEAVRAKLDLENIVDSLNSGLIVLDSRENILYMNNSAKKILELKGLPATNLKELKLYVPEFAEMIERVINEEEPVDREELSIKSNSGKTKPIGISISFVKDDFELFPRYVIVVFQDITEVKEIEKKLRVQEKFAAIGEFTAQIGHEIRIPLNSISIAVGKIRDIVRKNNIKLTESEEILIKAAEDDLERIVNFVETLQNFTNVDKFKPSLLPLGKEFYTIAQYASQAIRDIEAVFYTISNIAAPDVIVEFDRRHLEQILYNLVSNAYDALIESRKKGGYITVILYDGMRPYKIFNDTEYELEPEIGEGQVAIIVEDNGPGIPENIKEEVFYPFYTTKKSGTGLGLSIVRRLVELNGGEIKLYSFKNVGTAFVIIIKKYKGKRHGGKGKGTDS